MTWCAVTVHRIMGPVFFEGTNSITSTAFRCHSADYQHTRQCRQNSSFARLETRFLILILRFCDLSAVILKKCYHKVQGLPTSWSPLFKTLLWNKASQTTSSKWTLKSMVDADLLTAYTLRDIITKSLCRKIITSLKTLPNTLEHIWSYATGFYEVQSRYKNDLIILINTLCTHSESKGVIQ